MKRINIVSAVAILWILLLFGSCKKSIDNTIGPTLGTIPGVVGSKIAYLSVVHAAPKTTALDLALDGKRLYLNFFNYTNRVDYFRITAGTRAFSVYYSGDLEAAINRNIELAENKYYSLFIVDTLSKMSIVMAEDVPTLPGADSVKIRLANMSPDIGKSDLYIEGEQTPIAKNIDFKGVSQFYSIKAVNNVILEITPAGNRNSVWARTDRMNLLKGNFYTIWAGGFESISTVDGRIRAQAIRH